MRGLSSTKCASPLNDKSDFALVDELNVFFMDARKFFLEKLRHCHCHIMVYILMIEKKKKLCIISFKVDAFTALPK